MKRDRERSEEEDAFKDYKLTLPPTNKNKIKHPRLSEAGVIPKLGASLLLIGKSNSGKSVLLYNLLHDKRFYGDIFDKIFLFSATADVDDILEQLKLPEGQTFSNLVEAEKAIYRIMAHQSAEIEKHGNAGAKQFAMVFDDVIGDVRFLNSPAFTRSFIAPRHFNETTFLCSQHLRKVPKAARMQATWIALFPCSQSEMDTIIDEFCPAFLTKKQFQKMLEDVWGSRPYQFLSIHMRQPEEKRYRAGMGLLLDLNAYRQL